MFRVVCVAVALIACVSAQTNETETQTDVPVFGGDMGGIVGSLGQVQMQQAMMHHYATVLIEWQSAQAWSSAIGFRVQLHHQHNPKPSSFEENGEDLEEDEDEDDKEDNDRDLEMVGYGGMGMGYPGGYNMYNQYNPYNPYTAFTPTNNQDADPADLELQSEKMMWYALKVMWLEASEKLNRAQSLHYQNKVQMMMIQSTGAAQHPSIAQALMLMYYRSILETLRSSYAIQRQDTWSTYLLYEMLETTEFDNSANGLSDSFSDTLKHTEHAAMQTWYAETAIDVQTMFIDYYLNMLVSQLTGQSAYGSFGPGFGSFGATGAASSFLEETETAEPAEPAQPAQPFVGGPQTGSYFMYMIHIMKFYMRISHMNAAQSAYTATSISMALDKGTDFPNSDQAPKMLDTLKEATLTSWSQWAQMRLMLSYYEIVSLFYGVPIPRANHANAAAANLVQTEQPATFPTQQ